MEYYITPVLAGREDLSSGQLRLYIGFLAIFLEPVDPPEFPVPPAFS